MATLWGITIGCVIVILLTYMIVKSNKQLAIHQEQQELLMLCRTVQMALNHVVESLKKAQWQNVTYHLTIAQMRHANFTPKHPENQHIHQMIGTIITHITNASNAARVNDVDTVRHHLVHAAIAYNTVVSYLQEQIGNSDETT